MRTREDIFKEKMKSKEFRNAFNYYQPEYILGSDLIAYRIKHDMDSKTLAKKLGISKKKLDEIEGMNGNPSLILMKKIAEMLDSNLQITFKKKE